MLIPLQRRAFALVTTFFLYCFAMAQAPQITGPTSICVSNTGVYSIVPATGINYTWSATGHAVAPAMGSSTSVLFQVAGNITVTVVGRNTSGTIVSTSVRYVTVHALPDPVISADTRVGCSEWEEEDRDKPVGVEGMGAEGNCVKACEGSVVRYSTTYVPNNGYVWSASGGNVTASGQGWCDVQWGAQGQGSVTVTEENRERCARSTTICVDIIEKPTAKFRIMPSRVEEERRACKDQEIFFTDQSVGVNSPIVSWFWEFGDGTSFGSSTQVNPSHTYTQPGSYRVRLTVRNACNCTDVYEYGIEVTDQSPVPIYCPGVVCAGQLVLYKILDPDICDNRSWNVIGGEIADARAEGIWVKWNDDIEDGFGYLELTTDCREYCPGTTSLKIPVIRNNQPIKGKSVVCVGSQNLYRMPAWPGTTFSWSIISGSGTLVSTDQPNEIMLNAPSGPERIILHVTYYSDLLECRGEFTMPVDVTDFATITGPSNICQNTTASFRAMSGFSGRWQWQLVGPNGFVLNSGPNVTTFNTGTLTIPGTYTVKVLTADFCPPLPFTLTVRKSPGVVDNVEGATTVCAGNTYVYTAFAPFIGTTFKWTVTGGVINGSSSGRQVSVTWGAPPYSLRVKRLSVEQPYCASAETVVNVQPETVNLVIAGPTAPCANSHRLYSVGYTAGDSYEWSIFPQTAGSVSSGDGTPSIDILWNNVPANTPAQLRLKVIKCGVPTFQNYDVVINDMPAYTLAAPNTICRGASFSLTHNAPAGSDFVVDFGNGVVQTHPNYGNNFFNYEYPIITGTNNVNYTITVSITNPSFCVNPLVITRTITVQPSPVVSISPAGLYTECDPVFSYTFTANQQTGMVATTSLTWFTPSGAQPPCDPAVCSSISATQYGSYYVVATSANGCSSRSNTNFINDCSGSSGCVVSPTPTLTVTSNNNCGAVSVNGSYSTGGYNPAWTPPSDANNVVVSGNTITASFNKAGQYFFLYHVTYNDINNLPCTQTMPHLVTVPLVPGIVFGTTCAPGGYYLTLYDHSTKFPGATIVGYDYIIDGVTIAANTTNISATSSFVSGAGAHNIGINIYYTFPGIPGTVMCSVTKPITLASLPTANFIADLPDICVNAPLVFTNTSTGYVTSFWDFNDGATNKLNNVERVFSMAGLKNVSLTVTNAHGCTATVSHPVEVSANNLGGSINATPNPVCQGNLSNVAFSNSGGTVSAYTWKYNGSTILGGTSSSVPAALPGNYLVEIRSAKKCVRSIGPVNVDVQLLPDPVISGGARHCENETFVLNGYAGDDVTYLWNTPSGTFTTPQVALTLTYGNYSVSLTISRAGSACSKTVSYDVSIIAPPTLSNPTFQVVDCETYTVKLSAPWQSNNYSWSNGASGTEIYVNEGGPYRLYYTEDGCTSFADVMVPKDPKGFLWVVPTGCYTRCLPPSGEIKVDGPIIEFYSWEWNNGQSGQVSVPDPLLIYGGGDYTLTLATEDCSATSDTLHLDILDRCREVCDGVDVNFEGGEMGNCTVDFMIHINNNYQYPISYAISADVGGVITPATGVAAPGYTPVNCSWQGSAATPQNGSIRFIVRLYYDGMWCDKEFYYEYHCDERRQTRHVNPESTTEDVAQTKPVPGGPALTLAPNPATASTSLRYTTTGNAGRIEVYNLMGVKMFTAPTTKRSGNMLMQTANWPAGMYQVMLWQDGKLVKTSKLLVAH